MKLASSSGNAIGLVGPLFLLAYGLVAIVRPDIIAAAIQAAQPRRASELETPAVYRFLRIVGALVAAFALVILFRILGSDT